ncbi:MAG TPA: fibronectin type III domain-containing protein [Thermoanaerobaculia bacterium]|nr:fibronectin type III domain-containing protein [Thermoanaerobaculia bacterium]
MRRSTVHLTLFAIALAGLALAAAPLEAATAGTYNGTVGGRTFSLTVNSSNRITGWSSGGDYSCPGYSITSFSLSGFSCVIAANETFTCGSLGCGSDVNSRISGAFSGNTVTGTLDADFDPPTLPCCSASDQAFTASLAGGAVPAAPTNLVATPVTDDWINLVWQDNSNNEAEFRVEMREGTAGAFSDIGAMGANIEAAAVTGLDPDTLYQFRVRARNANGNSPYSNTASATTLGGDGNPFICIQNATTLCLNNNRFQVRATFRTSQPQTGQAQVVELTPDTGYLWFFAASNVEAVVKVLNACTLNNRYWVFAGGLTDVEVIMTVTDSQTGVSKTYTNPLGAPFQPIQDTNAFATCP